MLLAQLLLISWPVQWWHQYRQQDCSDVGMQKAMHICMAYAPHK